MDGGARLAAVVLLKAGSCEIASPFAILGTGASVGREGAMVSAGVWRCGWAMVVVAGERGVIVVCVVEVRYFLSMSEGPYLDAVFIFDSRCFDFGLCLCFCHLDIRCWYAISKHLWLSWI